MKEAIRMVPSSIYDGEFPDTSHWSSGRGCHSALRRIKEEWGTSRWFLEFDIRKCFHTINRHRFISILKEEIDDSKFLDSAQKLFSAGRLVGGEKGLDSVPYSVLLSALLGNIYLHKLDQEIGRIRQKHEIPLVVRIRSVLLRTGRRIDDQSSSGEEASFNAPQDNRAFIVGPYLLTSRSSRLATFHSSSWHTQLYFRRQFRVSDQKSPFVFSAALLAFQLKPSSLLCTAFLIEAYGLSHSRRPFLLSSLEATHYLQSQVKGIFGNKKNLAMRDQLQYCKRRGNWGDFFNRNSGEARRPLNCCNERGNFLSTQKPFRCHSFNIRIFYARYADDLLLGIVGAVFLLIEIQKRLTHFLQSGLNRRVGVAGSTTIAARSTVEFPGTVIREVPPRTTPNQFLRELEKRLRVKHRFHRSACHLRGAIHSKFRDLGSSIPIKTRDGRGLILDAVQLAETEGKEGLRSTQVSLLWGTTKHIRQGSREISLLHSSGRSKVPSDKRKSQGMSVFQKELETRNCLLKYRKASGKGREHWASGSFSSEFPIQIEAPIKKILRRLRDRGLISRRRPRPIHAASLTNVSDGNIVNWSAGIAISPLSYYRCCDNLDQVRTIVNYQIRWSAIFTLAHKYKSSARNHIPFDPFDSFLVNQEGGIHNSLAEFRHRAWEARTRWSNS
nr:maturase [Xyris pauciflora]